MTQFTRRVGLMVSVLGLVIGAGVPAKADLDVVFDASGTFVDGATLSGTLTVDVTTGTVTASALQVSAPDHGSFTLIQNQGLDIFGVVTPGYYGLSITTGSPNTFPVLQLGLNTTSLIGYGGGNMTAESNLAINSTTPNGLKNGELTTAVPEPSTALVAAFGAVAFIAYGLSRHRREQRQAAA
jgi:hypothetical protein